MKERIIIGACVVTVAFGAWRLFSSDLVSGGTVESGVRMVNIETGHRFKIEIGESFKGWPVKTPDTGKMTGYPAEACYWDLCGQKEGGTWVVLNETVGKPGETLCPECGNRVVGHNPLPPGTYVDQEGHLRQREGQPPPAGGDRATDGRDGRS
jgi:hypothetical protein